MSPLINNLSSIVQGILLGNRRAISKGITLIESQNSSDRVIACQLLDKLLVIKKQNNASSIRVGITGSPGAGKSTFIEALGQYFLNTLSKKIGILAIDPSSVISGGSILGDKTRMQTLAQSERVYIRPSPNRGHLGGVGQGTKESILILEASGHDLIFVETVGVGQSETLAHSMVDCFLYLQIPRSGDELQGVKRGILELADLVIINKCDDSMEEAGKRSRQELLNALSLTRNLPPDVICCSALTGLGIAESAAAIHAFVERQKQNGFFNKRRKEQIHNWYEQGLIEEFFFKMKQHSNFNLLMQQKDLVLSEEKSVRSAIKKVLDSIDFK